MPEKRIAHLIGNGPSKKFFQNEPVGDVYGCNFGTEGIKHKGLFMHDRRPLKHMNKHDFKLSDPLIARKRYENYLKPLLKKGLVDKNTLMWLPDGIRTRCSGNDGMIYLLGHAPENYKELHLWGFDSLTRGTVESDSKGKIDGSNPRQKMMKNWLLVFAKIKKQFKGEGKSIFLHYDDIKVEKVA
jgi:hypothetical protein